MIPKLDTLRIGEPVRIGKQPNVTYAFDFLNGKVVGTTDGLKAVEQAIYKILQTERYQYAIYNWDYGIEIADLFGKPRAYVYSELKRRIQEALMQDERIEGVDNFTFEVFKRDVIYLKFTVYTVFGEIDIDGQVVA